MLCCCFVCADSPLLANNLVPKGRKVGNAVAGEIFGTFIFCYVVLEVATNKRATAGNNGALAIGFTLLVLHLLLIPVSSCGLNPTRSLGPALVALIRDCNVDGVDFDVFADHWVFWVGPLV